MKVGLLAPPWLPIPPPSYGGIESVIDQLASGLQRAGQAAWIGAARALLIEALACGTPVVVCPVTAHIELFEEVAAQ